MSQVNQLSATTTAMKITVSKKVAGPLLLKLYSAVQDTTIFNTSEVKQVVKGLENGDNWAKGDILELEHILVKESEDWVTISMSKELAEAYVNMTVRTIPVLVSVYTAVLNVVALLKFSGLKQAVDNYLSLAGMTRVKREDMTAMETTAAQE
jgi:hypothetical protein